jgi:putative transposase
MKNRRDRAEQWQFYERQTNVSKKRAYYRLQVIDEIEELMQTGMNKSGAVNAVASVGKPSAASIWNWLSAVEGVERSDRLAYLVPGFRGGGRRSDVDHSLLQTIAADYLRYERPSWAECVRRLRMRAKERGVVLPHSRTLWRRLEREHGRLLIDRLRGEDQPVWLRARLPVNDR